MIASTFLGLFMVPALHVLVRRIFKLPLRMIEDEE
jgi:hypothetical protein